MLVNGLCSQLRPSEFLGAATQGPLNVQTATPGPFWQLAVRASQRSLRGSWGNGPGVVPPHSASCTPPPYMPCSKYHDQVMMTTSHAVAPPWGQPPRPQRPLLYVVGGWPLKPLSRKWSWCRFSSQGVLYTSSAHATLRISCLYTYKHMVWGSWVVGALPRPQHPGSTHLPGWQCPNKMVLVSLPLTGRPVRLLRTCHAPHIMLVYIQTHGVGWGGVGVCCMAW